MRTSALRSRELATGQAPQENRAVPDPTGEAMARGPCLMTVAIAAVAVVDFYWRSCGVDHRSMVMSTTFVSPRLSSRLTSPSPDRRTSPSGHRPPHRRVACFAVLPGGLGSAPARALQQQTADQRHLRQDQRHPHRDVPAVTCEHARLTEEDDAAGWQPILGHAPALQLPPMTGGARTKRRAGHATSAGTGLAWRNEAVAVAQAAGGNVNANVAPFFASCST